MQAVSMVSTGNAGIALKFEITFSAVTSYMATNSVGNQASLVTSSSLFKVR